MSVNYAWAVTDALGVPGNQKNVAMVLVRHRNHITGQCNPSLETIEAKTGLSRSTVLRALAALVSKGLLTRVHRRTETGDQTSNQYDFNLEAWLALGGTSIHRGVTQTPPGVTQTLPGVTQTLEGCHPDTQSSFEVKREEKEKGDSFDSPEQEGQKPTKEMILAAARQNVVTVSMAENWAAEFVAAAQREEVPFTGTWEDFTNLKMKGPKSQRTALQQSGTAKPVASVSSGGIRSAADILGGGFLQ